MVKPGVAETPTERARFIELIRLLFPTLGYPMIPTVTAVFIFLLRE